MNIFVAGATGVIGRLLVPMLVKAGHAVTGTTRSRAKLASIKAQGAKAVIADALDAAGLREAVAAARPDVVIHQLTDLPQIRNDATKEDLARNARLRIEGTPNLVSASLEAGAKRLIAQSLAFAYAPSPTPPRETDPLDTEAQGLRRTSVQGVIALEQAVVMAAKLEGIVLRYARLYGPGTWFDRPEGVPSLHVDPAAHAALLTVTRGSPGIYNIADDDGGVSIEKARRELGFDPGFRLT